jgi:hypothetical protein
VTIIVSITETFALGESNRSFSKYLYNFDVLVVPVQLGVPGVEAHAGGHHPQLRHVGVDAHPRVHFGQVLPQRSCFLPSLIKILI